MAEAKPGEERTLHRVRTLIVLDPVGGAGRTPEEEFEEIVETYRELYDLVLDAKRSETFSPHGHEADGCELVIFDWGGASIGNDLLQHQVRWLVNWAGDHPGALVVIRSMAWAWLEVAVEDEVLPKLPNMVLEEGTVEIPAWWRAGLTERA